jgi:CheY-like chemotaxis protein
METLAGDFSVVVSDLMMPELDGIGLTAKIKAHPGHRPRWAGVADGRARLRRR